MAKKYKSGKCEELVTFMNSDHVTNSGISHSFLNAMVNCFPPEIKSNFEGVFPMDKIPISLLHKTNWACILNLSAKSQLDAGQPGHFVTLICMRNYVLYLDPIGLYFIPSELLSYLEKMKLPIFANISSIQSNDSKFCGLYCLFFLLYILGGKNRNEVPQVNFSPGDFDRKNDLRCVDYIKQYLNL